jgi:alpha-L-fucosidase 2
MLTLLALSGLLFTTAAAAEPLLDLKAPIKRWDEGIPLGNGLVGALVWGEGSTLRISLDRGDLWDTRVPDIFKDPEWNYGSMIRLKESGNHARHQALFDAAYDTIPYPTKLPGGRLQLKLPDGLEMTRFFLTVEAGTANVEITQPYAAMGVAVDPEHPVVVIWGLPEGTTPELLFPDGLAKLYYPKPERGADAHATWFVQTNTDGSFSWAVYAASDAHSCAVAVSSSKDSKDPLSTARELATRAARAPESVRPALAARYGRLAKPQVTVPDAAIQRQYDLCRYLTIAGSQPHSPPMALQGVWTADEGGLPPWKGDYHNDLNTQTTYIAYQAADLIEEGSSFVNFLWDLTPRFERFAREFYGVGGLVVPGVMGIDGAPLGGWGQYSLSTTHTAWLAQSFYLHWRYTMDAAFLKDRAYPWCAKAGEAIAALLKPDATGKLVLPLSTSPEIHDNSARAWLTPNSNYDNALVTYLFRINERMARELGLEKEAAKWSVLTSRMPTAITDDTGALMFAKGEPFAESHRHFSHAMAIHPLDLLTIEGSDADRRTIDATLSLTEKMGTKAWCGYSFSWFAAMNARTGHAEAAAENLHIFSTAFVSRNGFHLNGDQSGKGYSNFTYRPFTLEGNFLAMHAVHEMLLQSWGGKIRIFPATPWKEARFDGLLAEGAVVVSAQRVGGKTTRVTLEARVDGEVRVVNPFAGEFKCDVTYRVEGRELVLRFKKGQRVVMGAR